MKACKNCGESKPLADYYVHSRMTDGRLNQCKECVKARVRAHRTDNIDRIREYDRSRGSRMTADDLRAQRARHPEKYKARMAVGNALRDGRLTRQDCEQCGAEDNIHAHHDDYSRPLDVRWLCSRCHHAHHASENEAGRI